MLCNVIYVDPPGVPHIEGYTEGDNLEKGQQVMLRCVSKVGNPPTQLSWFRNDELILNEYRYTHNIFIKYYLKYISCSKSVHLVVFSIIYPAVAFISLRIKCTRFEALVTLFSRKLFATKHQEQSENNLKPPDLIPKFGGGVTGMFLESRT